MLDMLDKLINCTRWAVLVQYNKLCVEFNCRDNVGNVLKLCCFP